MKREPDWIAIEEPLEIRLEYRNTKNLPIRRTIAITMRTPGHDADLAIGFLFNEGIIRTIDEIIKIEPCGAILNKAQTENIIRVELSSRSGTQFRHLEKHFLTNSSCGVCGKTSIEALRSQLGSPCLLQSKVSAKTILDLQDTLRKAQSVFDQTGGLHASGLFNLQGELIAMREDVGRHNALDKLIGHLFMHRQLPFSERILLMSGRLSFELVQKASMAGCEVIAAVGAPSSLAIDLAQELNMTLIGFIKKSQFNVYSGGWRIDYETENSKPVPQAKVNPLGSSSTL